MLLVLVLTRWINNTSPIHLFHWDFYFIMSHSLVLLVVVLFLSCVFDNLTHLIKMYWWVFSGYFSVFLPYDFSLIFLNFPKFDQHTPSGWPQVSFLTHDLVLEFNKLWSYQWFCYIVGNLHYAQCRPSVRL